MASRFSLPPKRWGSIPRLCVNSPGRAWTPPHPRAARRCDISPARIARCPQEVSHFRAAVIENPRAPVGMLAQARIVVLVKVRAVEERQAVGVGGKVRRHPVQDHADPVLVAVIDEIHEVFRSAVAAGGREVAHGLITPRFIQRMLHHRQQFDVRKALLRRRSPPVVRPVRDR